MENQPQSSTDIIITDIDIIDDSDCTACANDDEKKKKYLSRSLLIITLRLKHRLTMNAYVRNATNMTLIE